MRKITLTLSAAAVALALGGAGVAVANHHGERGFQAADANGDICVYTSSATALVVDVNAVAGEDGTVLNRETICGRVQHLCAGGGCSGIPAHQAASGATC